MKMVIDPYTPLVVSKLSDILILQHRLMLQWLNRLKCLDFFIG
uniref:Uncharacterized protein n=1 Tax=Stomoxys calcitrans TaxID=35570 RepID=A0A1I8Q8E0_STOCA